MSLRYIGLVIGLVVGVVWVALGLEKLIVVLVIGAVGYLIGGVLAGEIDVQRYLDNLRRK
ncbi:MAG TPA: hypothetical protein VK576_12135 [Thermoleophilia bacterium]|nr:hypothetical protein [Thermoleophilia bacterium]